MLNILLFINLICFQDLFLYLLQLVQALKYENFDEIQIAYEREKEMSCSVAPPSPREHSGALSLEFETPQRFVPPHTLSHFCYKFCSAAQGLSQLYLLIFCTLQRGQCQQWWCYTTGARQISGEPAGRCTRVSYNCANIRKHWIRGDYLTCIHVTRAIWCFNWLRL